MEIERKWMVKGWPEESASLPLVREQLMRQGYVTVYPTVRIREEAEKGGSTEYILCFKSPPSRGGLSRKEIEFPITPEQFAQLEDLIGFPLIPKLRRSYRLADGLLLEVNLVDQGMETEFMYAGIAEVRWNTAMHSAVYAVRLFIGMIPAKERTSIRAAPNRKNGDRQEMMNLIAEKAPNAYALLKKREAKMTLASTAESETSKRASVEIPAETKPVEQSEPVASESVEQPKPPESSQKNPGSIVLTVASLK